MIWYPGQLIGVLMYVRARQKVWYWSGSTAMTYLWFWFMNTMVFGFDVWSYNHVLDALLYPATLTPLTAVLAGFEDC